MNRGFPGHPSFYPLINANWHDIGIGVDVVKTSIDKFRRVVVPKQMRKRHGLLPGTEIIVEDTGEAIVVKPVADQSDLVEKEGLMVFRGTAMGDLDASMRGQCAERLRRAGGIIG